MKKKIISFTLLAIFTFIIQSCDIEVSFIPILNVDQTEYTVGNAPQTLEIGVSTNGEIEALTTDDWLKVNVLQVNDSTVLHIEVAGYETIGDNRKGNIEVKLKQYGLTHNIVIIQQPKDGVLVDQNVFILRFDEPLLKIPVKSNCDFKISIPEEDQYWIRLSDEPRTRALTESDVFFTIDKNETYEPRSTTVIFTLDSSKDADTVYITQDFNSLAMALKEDKSISLFYQAMVMTGLIDSIRRSIDESFSNSYYNKYERWTLRYVVTDFYINFLDTMYVKYTVFCETDEMLRDKYNINTIDDLIRYASRVYNTPAIDNTIPVTDRNHPLNKFISYHILPMGVSYDKLNAVNDITKQRFIKWDTMDFEDFYSPMLEHSTLKVSTPYMSDIKYLNRKGNEVEGIAVEPNGIIAANGYAYYLTDALVYTDDVRNNVLDTRIRVLASTLFPEIMSNGGRDYNRYGKEGYSNGYEYEAFSYNEFDDPFTTTNYSRLFTTRLRHTEYKYMGEGIFLNTKIDLSFKIPAVPNDGEYEIRFTTQQVGNSHYYQFYLNDTKCGEPIKLDGPYRYKDVFISDEDLLNEEEINAYDDSLRAHGIMKDVASYTDYDGRSLRDLDKRYRIILCSDYYMQSDKDYYLRIQGLDNNPRSLFDCEIRMEMIEIVPKKIYDGPVREDKY